MHLVPHPELRVRKLHIGREQAPLLVIDNFVANAEQLVDAAVGKRFTAITEYFPGIRVKAPLLYKRYFIDQLQDLLFDFFRLRGTTLTFSVCYYSLVTTPGKALLPIQRVPHIDTTNGNGLASVHYLFKRDLGGTAFYRHRKTGFEYVDAGREKQYYRILGEETGHARTGFAASSYAPPAAYINGDTPLFEQIAVEQGLFNRLLVYRRNSLHSGAIDTSFVPDSNPLTGRLSINSFIDVV
jgi:hypothetical protein